MSNRFWKTIFLSFLYCLPLCMAIEVVIPKGTIKIYDGEYFDRKDITSITIPDSVTFIGNSAFWGCSGLTSITIPDSVTSIGKSAFNGCSGLTSITIPDSVTSIGEYAFEGCRSLTSITIPDSVTSIGGYAFSGCSGLTSVVIGNSVTSIGDRAFYDCSGLTSVVIGNSVTSIGGYAFSRCNKLIFINVSKDNEKYRDIDGVLYDYDINKLICMPAGLKECPPIPDSVTSIGESAFSGCSGLTSITIPDSVTSIGESAFSGCSGLTSVVIGNSVTSIGNFAFYGCSGLTSITIPDSVTSIGDYAFGGCSGLTSVVIGNSVTFIGGYAFSGCSGLISVTIPQNVKSIGTLAFAECANLSEVTIEVSPNQYLGNDIFENCNAISRVNFPYGEPVKQISFGSSSPIIYEGSSNYNGYKVVNIDVVDLEQRKISEPTIPGKIGQVLMVTANGYEWVSLPNNPVVFADSFQLPVGWNLISMPDAELTQSCKQELLKKYKFFTFDSKSKAYLKANDLLPRTAYWVFATESSTIHFTVLK